MNRIDAPLPSPRRATIFGGHGFIGHHLQKKLVGLGWNCHLPPRNSPIMSEFDYGYVFYCAGLTADYLHRPFDTVDAHVTLLSQFFKSARFSKLVYLSSTRLYDNHSGDIACEDTPLSLVPSNPRHLYDLSKALGESLCHVGAQGRAKIVRLSCVYNDHRDREGFLPGLLRQIIEHRPRSLNIDSSPFFSRDYIHLEDVIEALTLIATQGTATTYNVAGGCNIENRLLFSLLEEKSGTKIIPLRQDASSSAARISIERMQQEFLWHPKSVENKITEILKENL